MLKGLKEDSTYLKHYIAFAIMFYVIVVICYMTLGGYKEVIPSYMETDRILVVGYYAIMLSLAFIRSDIKAIAFLNSVLFLLVVLLIRYTYAESGLGEFGHARDSYTYMSILLQYGDLSYSDFMESVLRTVRVSTADYGYYSIIYLCYQIYPDFDAIVILLLSINAICLYISIVYLFKIQRLFNCSHRFSKITALLYAASPFVVMTAVSGLKEIIFVNIIVLAIYFITLSYFHRTVTHIAIAFIFSFLCIYFRTAIAFMLFISLIVSITITEHNKKVYLLTLIILISLIGFLLPIILEYFMGTNLEQIMNIATNRYEGANNNNTGFGDSMISLVSSVLGPFPNFDRQGSYAFIHSLALFMKNVFNIFFLYGVYRIIRAQEIKFYPILIYIAMSILMVNVAGVSLDMRFHITYIPFFYVIALNAFKKHIIIDYSFLFLMFVVIFMYSTRPIHYVN